jgi:hypothetical protein
VIRIESEEFIMCRGELSLHQDYVQLKDLGHGDQVSWPEVLPVRAGAVPAHLHLLFPLATLQSKLWVPYL